MMFHVLLIGHPAKIHVQREQKMVDQTDIEIVVCIFKDDFQFITNTLQSFWL